MDLLWALRLASVSYRFNSTQKLCLSQFQLRPAAPSIPPPGWPPGINNFLALDGKFPGVGTPELSNHPRWGLKKRANSPSSVNTATFFFGLHSRIVVNSAVLNILMCVSSNVFPCNSARILIRISRDNMHQFMVLVSIKKLLTLKLIERCKVVCFK